MICRLASLWGRPPSQNVPAEPVPLEGPWALGLAFVVAARGEGGAVRTAKCAQREGRAALVVRWPPELVPAGNRELLAGGALTVEPDQDPLAALGRGSGGDDGPAEP